MEFSTMSQTRQENHAQLDLTYLTKRIIAAIFHLEGEEANYKSSLYDMMKMLKDKHGENYLIINLSERQRDMHQLHKQVLEFGWPDTLSPPLERLCNICKSVDSWLSSSPKNVVVIHCKGGLGRLAVVIAAYIDYCSICVSEDQAMDRLAMKHFYEGKLARIIQPSQRRYVHYFAGLLSGAIKINNSTLFLHQIILHGNPKFDDQDGCRPFIKIYQGMQPIYVSNVFISSKGSSFICVTLDPCLQLRSDVLVKCFNKSDNSPAARDVIFRCQFHTCTVSDNLLKFGKSELDEACNDQRFPNQGWVEFVFTSAPERISRPDLVSEIGTSLDRWNSYENFNLAAEDDDGACVSRFPLSGGKAIDTSSTMMSKKISNQNSITCKMSTKGNMTGFTLTRDESDHSDIRKRASPSAVQYNFGISSHNWMTTESTEAPTSNHVVPQVPVEPGNEQEHLDEILRELLIDQMTMHDAPAQHPVLPVDAVVPSSTGPGQGVITTESDNMRTTLSWQTSQAGPKKSAVVTRQTVAQPSPHARVESDSTRYREVSSQRFMPEIETDKWGASECYSYQTPFYRESKRLETHSETTTREEIVNPSLNRWHLGSNDVSATARMPSPRTSQKEDPSTLRSSVPRQYPNNNIQRPRDMVQRSVSDYQHYASDSEDPVLWLEDQHSRLHSTRRDGHKTSRNGSFQYKQSVAELKSAQNAYYTTEQVVQCDTEDVIFDQRGHHSKFEPTCSSDDILPRQHASAGPVRTSAPTSPVVPERGDSSREAVLRTQATAREWIKSNEGYRHDAKNSSQMCAGNRDLEQGMYLDHEPQTIHERILSFGHLGPPVHSVEEVEEVITLQPIGCGIQNLESGTAMDQYRTIKPSSNSTADHDGYTSNQTTPSCKYLTAEQTGLQQSPYRTYLQGDRVQTVPYRDCHKMQVENLQTMHNAQSTIQSNLAHVVKNSSQALNIQLPNNPSSFYELHNTNLIGESGTTGLQKHPHIQQQHFACKQEQSTSNCKQNQTWGSESRTFSQGIQQSSISGSYANDRSQQDGLRLNNSSMSNLQKSSSLGHGLQTINQLSDLFQCGQARATSASSLAVIQGHSPKLSFNRDVSHSWHKENLTREGATAYLLDKPPGWFVVRNSCTYPGAYGLAVKVAQIPPNVIIRGNPQTELVRHFLIEPTSRGVQLKGNPIEPVFDTLAALVYQHTRTPLALPLKLVFPEYNAFNVLYINSVEMGCLTGPEAVARAIDITFDPAAALPDAVEVSLKVSSLGITLTDNKRRLFFRRHYPMNSLTYCGLDGNDRRWTFTSESSSTTSASRIFGFIACKQGSTAENACHLFAELDPTHPSSAIVGIITDAMSGQGISAPNAVK